MKFKIGDKVIKNTRTWRSTEFDEWGRGLGVGVVLSVFDEADEFDLDVRWPAGRCYESSRWLLLAT